ncbi:hypothetical protein MN608_09013 [Microdochium nivale]|nr:hypothetical protein MN608_09013 [Microdochium nivale]
MSLGTLTAKAVLDKPQHLYCGASEPITGRVCLWYEPGKGLPADHELFGPLSISVVFYGRLKTKILDTNHVHRGRVPLFTKSKEIFNGAIRITRGDCQGQRFELTLPERIETKALHSWDEDDNRFDLDLRQTLPPSTKTSSTRFGNRFNAFVEYKLSLRVTMGNMQVKIVVPEPAHEPSICYEQPRVSHRVRARRLEFKGEFNIPESSLQHPQFQAESPGLVKKRLGVFGGKSVGCIYDWSYSVPQHVHRGEYARIKLQVKPREGSFVAGVIPPEVTVKDYSVRLVSVVHARAPTHILSSPHAVTTTCVSTIDGRPAGAAMDEAFGASNAWTTFLDLPSTAHVSTTFKTISIRQSHRLELSITLAVAGQTANIQKILGLTIHAPLVLPGDIMEDLPVYEPVEQPPEYGSHEELRFSPLAGILPPSGAPTTVVVVGDMPPAATVSLPVVVVVT